MKNTLTQYQKALLLLALFVFIIPWYFITNQIKPIFQPYTLISPLDMAVSFNMTWHYFYIFVFILSLLPVFLIKDNEYFRRSIYAYTFMMCTSFVIFLLFPVGIARPHTFDDRTFIGWALHLIYFIDKPYNCFPSLHLGMAFLSSFIVYRLDKLTGVAALIVSSLIGISTLKIKQHYFLDAMAGIILAYISYVFFIQGYQMDPLKIMDYRHSRKRVLFFIVFACVYFVSGLVLYRLNFRPWMTLPSN